MTARYLITSGGYCDLTLHGIVEGPARPSLPELWHEFRAEYGLGVYVPGCDVPEFETCERWEREGFGAFDRLTPGMAFVAWLIARKGFVRAACEQMSLDQSSHPASPVATTPTV